MCPCFVPFIVEWWSILLSSSSLRSVITPWLLRAALLWILTYKPLCGHLFSFLLSRYLGLELLGQMVDLCVTCKELPNYLPQCPYQSECPSAMLERGGLPVGRVCLFDGSHSCECEVVSLWLSFASHQWPAMWSIFSRAYFPSIRLR